MKLEVLKDKTVGEIVSENIDASHIFKKHGIDFCCGGGITVEKACELKGVALQQLVKDLEANRNTLNERRNYNNWSLSVLMDHIKTKHHEYVRSNLALLNQYADKVESVHGQKYPHLLKLKHILLETTLDLMEHMEKEEKEIFPAIYQMEYEASIGEESSTEFTIENPLAEIFEEHEEAAMSFKKISELTNNYTAPADACKTFIAFYNLLKAFEDNLHLHVHLENNILFPKAQQLFNAPQKTTPMKNYKSPILFATAGILLLLLFVFPIWKIILLAPQYPDGVEMHIYINKIGGKDPGTLQNINILNHYIGMKKIEPDSIPELKYFPKIVLAFAILAFIFAFVNNKHLYLFWVITLGIGLCLAVYDFYLWEYDYGHNLDPNAIMKFEGESFQPPLIGRKNVINFVAISLPHWGGYAIMLSMSLAVAATYLKIKK